MGGAIKLALHEPVCTISTASLPFPLIICYLAIAGHTESETKMSCRTPEQCRLHILIVEDDDLLRKLFYEAFRDRHSVYAASSAEDGWDFFLDKSPEIVFLDIGLPGANGHTLAHKIKKRRPGTYVVMATSSGDPDDVEKAMQNYADGFIVKPFDKETICSYIEKYMAVNACET
jgi:DNA-binding NtrC family response regulator